ncbi:Photosystem I psaF [Amphidinium carterae]
MAVIGKMALVTLGMCVSAAMGQSFVPLAGPHMTAGSAASRQGMQQKYQAFESLSDASLPAAAQGDNWTSMLRWVGAGRLVAGVVAAATATPVQAAIDTAPVTKMKNLKTGTVEVDQTKLSVKSWGHMEPCGTNKKFQKRIKDEAFKLKKRQDKYAKGSAAYAGVQEVIDQAKDTAKAYEGRWCGKKDDGLPRVIATGEITRGGHCDPSIDVLVHHWLDWLCRPLLPPRTKDAAKEIKIDVPLALTCMTSAFAWPVYSWQDITNGRFVAKDTEIRVQRMHMA